MENIHPMDDHDRIIGMLENQSQSRETHELLHSIGNPSFGEILLHRFSSIFGFDYAHIASLNSDLKIDVHNATGDGGLLMEAYRSMERHCLTKQEQYVTPPSIIPFNIDSDMWRVLSVINPAYRAMSEVIPRLIIAGMVHPERMAIIGMRYSDDDLTDDQLGLHSFLSPGFIHYYHIHQIITRYRDMNSYLASELSRMHDDEWVLADGPLGIVTRSDGFDDAMKRHRLTWKDLQGFIQSSMHREAAGLFTAVECSHGTPGSPPLTLRLQPVYVEKRKYLRITLSESATAIPLTPREREIYHLLCKGLTNRSIGEILSISTETVKRHLANIFEKTGARNRTELSHMKL